MTADEIKSMLTAIRAAIHNESDEGSVLCEELHDRPDVHSVASELSFCLAMLCGAGIVPGPISFIFDDNEKHE